MGPADPPRGDWFLPQERLRGWRDVLEPAGIEPVVRHEEAEERRYSAELVARHDRAARPA